MKTAQHRMIATPEIWAAAILEDGELVEFDQTVYLDATKAKRRVHRLQNLEDEVARLDREGGHERPEKAPWQVVRVFGYVEVVKHHD